MKKKPLPDKPNSISRTVLYIVPSAHIGGAETFIQHTALFHTEYEPIYILLRNGPLYHWLASHQKKVHLCPTPVKLSRPWTFYQASAWIQTIIHREKVSIVHSNMAYAALVGGLISQATQTPHVWYQHGPASGWMDSFAGVLPHKTLFVNSDYTRQTQTKLEKPFHFLAPKTRHIKKLTLGVDLNRKNSFSPDDSIALRQSLYQKASSKNALPIFAMMTRLQKWKGVHLFIRAIAELQKNTPCLGVIWGGSSSPNESSEYEKELRQLSQKQNASILFLGPTDAPLLSLSAVDFVVNASIQPEPFGLSIIEGMSVGAIPIVPDEGGAKEIIETSQCGFTFQARSSQSLTQTLMQALNQTQGSTFQSIKQNCISSTQKYFDAKKTIQNLEQSYEETLTKDFV